VALALERELLLDGRLAVALARKGIRRDAQVVERGEVERRAPR
jgi:hypothetical protein